MPVIFEKKGYAKQLEESQLSLDNLLKAIQDVFFQEVVYKDKMSHTQEIQSVESFYTLLRARCRWKGASWLKRYTWSDRLRLRNRVHLICDPQSLWFSNWQNSSEEAVLKSREPVAEDSVLKKSSFWVWKVKKPEVLAFQTFTIQEAGRKKQTGEPYFPSGLFWKRKITGPTTWGFHLNEPKEGNVNPSILADIQDTRIKRKDLLKKSNHVQKGFSPFGIEQVTILKKSTNLIQEKSPNMLHNWENDNP